MQRLNACDQQNDRCSYRYKYNRSRRYCIPPHSASKRVIDALFAGQFLLLLSRETLLEVQRVLSDPEIMYKHGWADKKLNSFCLALELRARLIEPRTVVPPSLTRDFTDTKWVTLALDGQADFLVTLDRRHLRRLKRIGETRIIGPAEFLRELEASQNKRL
jgi:uncharacterized protein